jgi:FtsP/CotA-like multicopper oxidase with cupredoxin domain
VSCTHAPSLLLKVVNITVINQLETSTLAIHWHGISQRGSPWSDGADQVTQCGIPPGGGAYSYVFKPDQVGKQGGDAPQTYRYWGAAMSPWR